MVTGRRRMKFGAPEWTPSATISGAAKSEADPARSMGGASTASFIPENVSEATSKKQNLENELVQVIRNGCIFFVHRSQAATGQAADATFSNMALVPHSRTKCHVLSLP